MCSSPHDFSVSGIKYNDFAGKQTFVESLVRQLTGVFYGVLTMAPEIEYGPIAGIADSNSVFYMPSH
jgi:hypothetical protein